jgi:hypothetical protein
MEPEKRSGKVETPLGTHYKIHGRFQKADFAAAFMHPLCLYGLEKCAVNKAGSAVTSQKSRFAIGDWGRLAQRREGGFGISVWSI